MNTVPATSVTLLDLPATEIYRDDLEVIGHIFGHTGPRLRCTVSVPSRYGRTKGIRGVFGRILAAARLRFRRLRR